MALPSGLHVLFIQGLSNGFEQGFEAGSFIGGFFDPAAGFDHRSHALPHYLLSGIDQSLPAATGPMNLTPAFR